MDADQTLKELGSLVLKSGVGLGGLTHPQRLLALRVAAAVLPLGTQVSEPQANDLLRQALAAEAAFMGTDHVELRRWLVDTHWWARDGFGRAYWRTPPEQLSQEQRAIEDALAPLDLAAWIPAQRRAATAARDARRTAWQARLSEAN